MKHPLQIVKVTPLLLVLAGIASSSADSIHPTKVQFVANTNVKMFKFTGEAKDMTSTVARADGSLRSFEFAIPISAIKTGMDVRDKHMVERIFTTAEGKTPDVGYRSKKVECKPANEPGTQTCSISGDLTIRGQTKDFPLVATLKNGSDVTGRATIDVLQFGVNPDSLKYAKVVVENQVALEFEAKLQ